MSTVTVLVKKIIDNEEVVTQKFIAPEEFRCLQALTEKGGLMTLGEIVQVPNLRLEKTSAYTVLARLVGKGLIESQVRVLQVERKAFGNKPRLKSTNCRVFWSTFDTVSEVVSA